MDRAQPHYFNEIYIYLFFEYIFLFFLKAFYHNMTFYSNMKLHFYHKLFLTAATLAPNLATYVFTTRAIQMIRIKIKICPGRDVY